jgi:glycosyltransferase involved in cell wall biosynthesis
MLVSAITIFLDGAHFLPEAIESVLAQTYPHWELLLVDDGSTDGAAGIARGYAARDPDRIRYLAHPGHRNRGMSASRNLGLRAARGEFVAFLDGDDVWLPGKLETQVATLRAHPAADMTCGATLVWHTWTGAAEDVGRDGVRLVQRGPDELVAPPELLRRYLRGEALTPATCSVLLRRSALARTGLFEPRFRGLYEDQAFFVKAYHRLGVVVTGDVLDRYRQHPGSHSAEALRSGRYSLERPSRALTDLYLWCVWYFVRAGVVDRSLWAGILGRLRGVGLHLFSRVRDAVLHRLRPPHVSS